MSRLFDQFWHSLTDDEQREFKDKADRAEWEAGDPEPAAEEPARAPDPNYDLDVDIPF